MIQAPRVGRARKAFWALAGILGFLWLAFEDQGLVAVTLYAALLAAAIGLELYERTVPEGLIDSRGWALRVVGIGLLCGLLMGPLSALLMLFKVGLHAHPVPDFSPTDVVTALSRTAWWVAIGGIVGGLLAWIGRKG